MHTPTTCGKGIRRLLSGRIDQTSHRLIIISSPLPSPADPASIIITACPPLAYSRTIIVSNMHVTSSHTQSPATPIVIDKRTHGRGQLDAVVHVSGVITIPIRMMLISSQYIPARLTSSVSEATHVIILRDDYEALVADDHSKAEAIARNLWQRYGTRTLVSDEYLEVLAGARAPVPMDEYSYTLHACPTGSNAPDRPPHHTPEPAYQPRTKSQLVQPSSWSAHPSLAAALPSEPQAGSPGWHDSPSSPGATSPSAPAAVNLPLDSSAHLTSPLRSRRLSPDDACSSPSSSDASPPQSFTKRMRSDDSAQLAADLTQWSVDTDEDQCICPATDHRTAQRTAKRPRPSYGRSSTGAETIRHVAARLDSAFELSLNQLAIISCRGHWIDDPAIVLRCCRAQLFAHELLFVVDPSWRHATMHNGLMESRLAKSLLAPQTDGDARRQTFVCIFGVELFRRAWLEYADWSSAYLTSRSGAVRNAMAGWLDNLLELHEQGTNWRDVMGIHYDIHSKYADSRRPFVAVDFVLHHNAALASLSRTSSVDTTSPASRFDSQPPSSAKTDHDHRSAAHSRQTGGTKAMQADDYGGYSAMARDDGQTQADKGSGVQ